MHNADYERLAATSAVQASPAQIIRIWTALVLTGTQPVAIQIGGP
jgi:hypothetical protein